MPGPRSARAEAAFRALKDRARRDPDIAGFWLGGSRGKGRETRHSDYDCTVILADGAPGRLGDELRALQAPGVDLVVMSLSEFEHYAAWGSPQAWDRYSFAGLTALVDKTGRIQPMIDAKGRVPPHEVAAFINASLDHFLNQLYRGLKCLRDGDGDASRLEAAEGIAPFLDALFALNGGRLRPYYKYLAWELETKPLDLIPWPTGETMRRLMAALGPDSASGLQRLLVESEGLFRSAGHASAFDGWSETRGWMASWRPMEPPRAATT